MVICPDCGNPIRYINAARGNGVYMVNVDPESLIGETGRILTGFREHKCLQERRCTREPMNNQDCHAYNGGLCMNGLICAPAPKSGPVGENKGEIPS